MDGDKIDNQIKPQQTSEETSVTQDNTMDVDSRPQETENKEFESFGIQIVTCGENPVIIKAQVSPTDSIQDIKSYLIDSIDSCYITSYHLYVDNKKLNEFTEIGDNTEIKADSKIVMKEAPYEERGIKLHVRHLRDLMNIGDTLASSSTLFSSIIKEDTKTETKKEKETKKSANGKKDMHKAHENLIQQASQFVVPTLEDFYGAASDIKQPTPSPACVKSISYTGWNFPPGNRKFQGDLIYLEVVTLEEKTFHITGCTTGFYVSQSTPTKFDPRRGEKAPFSFTLAGLLNQISPMFQRNFKQVLNQAQNRNALDYAPMPHPVHSWIGRNDSHHYNINRVEDQWLLGLEFEPRGQLREWNEEYQTWKDLPKSSIPERIFRDRALIKFHAEYLEAATKGAIAIIDGTVSPINPLDPERTHMYLYNNIFYSYATDGRDIYKDQGGDRAAYLSINNDLKGVKAYYKADIKGLHTLATVIIDYRGHRLCAQSIIPGILQQQETAKVVYGSVDVGKKIQSDPAFHEVMSQAAKVLNIKEHTVIDPEGSKHTLAAAVDAKGILGTDGRKYVLDLIRSTPRDLNYEGPAQMLTTLRPELISNYIEYLRNQEESRREKEKADKAEKSEKSDKDESEAKVDGKNENEKKEGESEEIQISLFLNPDVGCDYKFDQTEEETQEDEEQVKKLAVFLKDTVIPVMIEEFLWLYSTPPDGEALTQMMHNHGINMRYLGYMIQKVERAGATRDLLMREMVTRAAKHVLRSLWREVADAEIANVTAHFLNCFIGEVSSSESDKKNKVASKKDVASKTASTTPETPVSPMHLTSSILWARITSEVKDRFKFDLESRDHLKPTIRSVLTLRSICKKTGIQLRMKDYEITTVAAPFSSEDILNLLPLTKSIHHESADAQQLLMAGKNYLGVGRLDIAHELITESLALCHNTYGPIHRETAQCYHNLALVLSNAKDLQMAIDNQERSVTITERTTGLDSNDTAQSYILMSMFYLQDKQYKAAVACMKRALYITFLMCGQNHPETITIYSNLAHMLQEQNSHAESLPYLQEALKSYTALLGPSTIQLSPIYHAIAIAYSNMNQFKEALNYEKKSYAILKENVGENDFRTQESNVWLRQFTTKAVENQREVHTQLSQMKIQKLAGNIADTQNRSSGIRVPSGAALQQDVIGNRSLEEILSYISGKSDPSSFMQRNRKNLKPQSAQSATLNGNADGSEKKKKQKKKPKKDDKESTQ